MKRHMFAICAYKESIFLEECIISLMNQTVKSKIILVTSTPNNYINTIAKKYGIKVYVNNGEGGITQDWNFAYQVANADYVTLAHQDDIYEKKYVETVCKILDKCNRPIICFTNYGELRNGHKINKSWLLGIKRLMLLPLKSTRLQQSIFIRRRILSFGSPICCPSVTYIKENCPDVIFKNGFRAAEDWQAWESLSKIDGFFVYVDKILIYHRIHGNSETTKAVADKVRNKEDYIMYRKFWPKPIAFLLAKLYSISERNNIQ